VTDLPTANQDNQPISRVQWTLLGMGLALFMATFAWTGLHLVQGWENPRGYYSHGWLVPAVSAFLLWRKRETLAQCALKPCAWGIPILAIALLMHLSGAGLGRPVLSGIGLVAFLWGIVLTFLGKEMLKETFFPLFFLGFMVPMPDAIINGASMKLKMWAAAAAAGITDLLGIIVFHDGSNLTLAESQYIPKIQDLLVDDECSGLKFAISLTAFGALYAYLSRQKLWGKLFLFAISVPISFIANVVRVTLMILISYRWGVEAINADKHPIVHYGLGIIVFVCAFGLLFLADAILLALWFKKPEEPEDASGAESEKAAPPKQDSPPPARSLPRLHNQVAFLLILAITAGLTLYMTRTRDVPSTTGILENIPLRVGNWSGIRSEATEKEKDILGTQDVMTFTYQNQKGRRVSLLVVLIQQIGRYTHRPEQCYLGSGNQQIMSAVRPISIPGEDAPISTNVREILFRKGKTDSLVWYFFKNGSKLNENYFAHQMGVAWDRFTKGDAPDILIRVDTRATDQKSPDEVRATLQDFCNEVMPELLDMLP
jgi:EpsI family protein